MFQDFTDEERRALSVVTACDGALRRAAAGDRDETAVALRMLLDLIVEVPAIGEICKRSREAATADE